MQLGVFVLFSFSSVGLGVEVWCLTFLFPYNSSNRDSNLLRVCSASDPKGSAYSSLNLVHIALLKFNAHNMMAL